MTRDQYVETLKSAARTIGGRAVISYLIAQVPFFGWPVVRQFVSAIVGWILDFAINKTEMGAFFLYVDLRVSRQGREFFEAGARHQNAKTEDERRLSEMDLKIKFRNLARFDA